MGERELAALSHDTGVLIRIKGREKKNDDDIAATAAAALLTLARRSARGLKLCGGHNEPEGEATMQASTAHCVRLRPYTFRRARATIYSTARRVITVSFCDYGFTRARQAARPSDKWTRHYCLPFILGRVIFCEGWTLIAIRVDCFC